MPTSNPSSSGGSRRIQANVAEPFVAANIEFKPDFASTSKRMLKSARNEAEAKDKSHLNKQSLGTVALLLVALACLAIGTISSVTSTGAPNQPTTPEADVSVPTPEPVEPVATVNRPTDADIDRETWRDDPQTLLQQLEFMGIFYSPRPTCSRIRLGKNLVAEGATVGDGEFTVVRIDPSVAFLRDRSGRLHRLIDPGQWELAAKEHKWPAQPIHPLAPTDTTTPLPASGEPLR